MKNIDLAKTLNVSPMFVSYLIRGKRFTTNTDLAKAIAARSGKKPIDHISPSLRKTYLAAYPELGRKSKVSKQSA